MQVGMRASPIGHPSPTDSTYRLTLQIRPTTTPLQVEGTTGRHYEGERQYHYRTVQLQLIQLQLPVRRG